MGTLYDLETALIYYHELFPGAPRLSLQSFKTLSPDCRMVQDLANHPCEIHHYCGYTATQGQPNVIITTAHGFLSNATSELIYKNFQTTDLVKLTNLYYPTITHCHLPYPTDKRPSGYASLKEIVQFNQSRSFYCVMTTEQQDFHIIFLGNDVHANFLFHGSPQIMHHSTASINFSTIPVISNTGQQHHIINLLGKNFSANPRYEWKIMLHSKETTNIAEKMPIPLSGINSILNFETNQYYLLTESNTETTSNYLQVNDSVAVSPCYLYQTPTHLIYSSAYQNPEPETISFIRSGITHLRITCLAPTLLSK